MANFQQLKQLLLEMDLVPREEDTAEELVVVSDDERLLNNLIIDLDDPIVVLTQVIGPATHQTDLSYLLELNNELVHGAFALTRRADDHIPVVVWRDTLRSENLDRNELEGSIDALSLALVEHGEQLSCMFRKRNQ